MSSNPIARAAVLSRTQLGQCVLKSVILKLNINYKSPIKEVVQFTISSIGLFLYNVHSSTFTFLGAEDGGWGGAVDGLLPYIG